MTPNFSELACMLVRRPLSPWGRQGHARGINRPSIHMAPGGGPPEGSGPQAQPGVGCRLCQPSLFQQGVVGAFAEGFGVLTSDFGVGKSQDLGLQPIMPLDLPVKVRSWELTVYPRSYIRRWLGVTRPAKART